MEERYIEETHTYTGNRHSKTERVKDKRLRRRERERESDITMRESERGKKER